MAERADFRFAGNVPEGYDAHLVAPVFEPMAEVLLDAVDPQRGERVLDVACGPGTVARAAARRVGERGRVTGCDISGDMLAIARAKPPEAEAAPIDYVEAPADALPFADASFDAVICQQALQFFPDKVAALTEMHRMLARGGRAGLLVFQPPDGALLFTTLRDVAARAGVIDPNAFPRGPFEYGTAEDLRRDFAAAGFEDVTVVECTVAAIFEGGLEHVIQAIRGTPFWPVIVPQGAAAIAAFEREARLEFDRFTDDGEVVRIDQRSHVVLAR